LEKSHVATNDDEATTDTVTMPAAPLSASTSELMIRVTELMNIVALENSVLDSSSSNGDDNKGNTLRHIARAMC
jgi:hypothetical protein